MSYEASKAGFPASRRNYLANDSIIIAPQCRGYVCHYVYSMPDSCSRIYAGPPRGVRVHFANWTLNHGGIWCRWISGERDNWQNDDERFLNISSA